MFADAEMKSDQELAQLRFEDLKPGDRYAIGTVEMTRPEIIAFAERYDPQEYHLDDAAAEANPVFGRLSASGWHTALSIQGLMDKFLRKTQVRGLAGGGVDQIRWLKPVFVGDVLNVELEVIASRASISRPERGVMTARLVGRNQNGEVVATMLLTGIFQR